jgi:hypothetical protein
MVTMKIKSMFFDRVAVTRAVAPAKIRVLSKIGAFIRKSAQTSMRYRKRASAPGQPPSAHKEFGALLRRLLFFGYDRSTDSVVVGPVATKRAEAPNLNEFGGKARRFGRMVTYPARPFMAPALAREEPKLPSYWTNSVKAG